jgi:isopentenyl phosphate kinase
MEALWQAGLPAMAFQPSAALLARDGQPTGWEASPLKLALEAGILPVVYGDAVFDSQRGATILSTEDLFGYLALQLRPRRLLIASLEDGVFEDYPHNTRRAPEITPNNYAQIITRIKGSAATDVTGGMLSKVQQCFELTRLVPDLEVFIFSGMQPGAIERALAGERMGTRIWTGVSGEFK